MILKQARVVTNLGVAQIQVRFLPLIWVYFGLSVA